MSTVRHILDTLEDVLYSDGMPLFVWEHLEYNWGYHEYNSRWSRWYSGELL